MVCAGCCDCGDEGWKTPCSEHTRQQSPVDVNDPSVSPFFDRLEIVSRFLVLYVLSSLHKYMQSSLTSTISKASRLLKSGIHWILAISKQGPSFMHTLTKALIDDNNSFSVSAVSQFLFLLTKPRSFPVKEITEFVITFSCDAGFRKPMLASLAPLYSELRSIQSPLLDSLTVQVFVSSLSVPDLISNNYVLQLLKAFHTVLFRCSNQGRFSWRTVDVSRHNTAFGEIACDLKYVFKHREAVISFFQSEESMSVFTDILCLLQWMSPCKRKTGAHIEFEDDNWMYAFELEIEIHEIVELLLIDFKNVFSDFVSGGLLWLLTLMSSKLELFFEYSCTQDISFHIPLHRAFVVLLSLFGNSQGHDIITALAKIVPDHQMIAYLDGLRVAPLQIQSTLSEMSAGLWKKNGEFSEQAEFFYRGSGFSTIALYPDLLCIQLSTNTTEPDKWLWSTAKCFGISPTSTLQVRICEEFLRLIVAVLCEPVNPCISNHDILRREIIGQLSTSEHGLTHSDLSDRLPSKFIEDPLYTSILREVSYFKSPHGTFSGRYCLKPSLYSGFDPFFFRLIQNDMTIAETRFHSLCQASAGDPLYCLELRNVPENLVHILRCPAMHSILSLMIRFGLSCDNQQNPERLFRSALYILSLDAYISGKYQSRSDDDTAFSIGPSSSLSSDITVPLMALKNSRFFHNSAELKHAFARFLTLAQNHFPDASSLLHGLWSVDRQRESHRVRIRARQSELLQSFSRKRQAFSSDVIQAELPSSPAEGSHDDQVCLLCFEKSTARKPLGAISFVSLSQVPYMAHRADSGDNASHVTHEPARNMSSSLPFGSLDAEDGSSSDSTWRPLTAEHGIGRRRSHNTLANRHNGRNLHPPNANANAAALADDGFESINMRQLFNALNRTPNGLHAVEEELGDLLVSIFRRWTTVSTSGNDFSLDFSWRSKSGCLFVQTCGHLICRPCFCNECAYVLSSTLTDSPVASYVGAQPPRFTNLQSSTFQCPVCRRLSNLHFPVPLQRPASLIGDDSVSSLDEWITSAMKSPSPSPNSRSYGSQSDYNLLKSLVATTLKLCNLRSPPPSVPASAVISLLLGNIIETVDISLHGNSQNDVPRPVKDMCKLLLCWVPICYQFESPMQSSRTTRRPAPIIKTRTFLDQTWRDIFHGHGKILHCNIFGFLIQLLPCLLSCPSTARNILDLMQLAQLVQTIIFAFRSNVGVKDDSLFPSLGALTVASLHDLIAFIYGALYAKHVQSECLNCTSNDNVIVYADILAYVLPLCQPFARKLLLLMDSAKLDRSSMFLDRIENLHHNVNRLLSSVPVKQLLFRWLSSDISPSRRVTRSLSPSLSGGASVDAVPIASTLQLGNIKNLNNLVLRDAFRLTTLPERFDALLATTRNKRWTDPDFVDANSNIRYSCDICDQRPSEQLCICLLCGSTLCWSTSQECSYLHSARRCDANNSIFLLLRDCVVAVVYNRASAIWGSLYLDCHGEEDRELSRGLPLYLQADRVRDLTSLYTSVGIADFIARSHHDNINFGGQAAMMFAPPMMFI